VFISCFRCSIGAFISESLAKFFERESEMKIIQQRERIPDRMGGGVAFWAYSEEEADDAVVAYRNAGYHFVEKARFEDIFSE